MSDENKENRRYLSKQQQVKDMEKKYVDYSYTVRDCILYNLGVGAKHTELPLVFEGANDFAVLPTFGVVPAYFAKPPFEVKDLVPNYDQRQVLHGEQYLEIKQFPIPTSGNLRTETHLIEVVDKGNAALVRRGNTTVDASNKPVFYSESVSFVRKAGGFGGAKQGSERGAATAANNPPKRSPDKVIEEKTDEGLAAIYRLMGDYNPLHIDPSFSKVGGFDIPILHGLASFGISGKHVFQTYGMFKNIKVRFSGVVLPGQTIVTEMWKEGGKVIFAAKVKETGKPCLSSAAVELVGEKANL